MKILSTEKTDFDKFVAIKNFTQAVEVLFDDYGYEIENVFEYAEIKSDLLFQMENEDSSLYCKTEVVSVLVVVMESLFDYYMEYRHGHNLSIDKLYQELRYQKSLYKKCVQIYYKEM